MNIQERNMLKFKLEGLAAYLMVFVLAGIVAGVFYTLSSMFESVSWFLMMPFAFSAGLCTAISLASLAVSALMGTTLFDKD